MDLFLASLRLCVFIRAQCDRWLANRTGRIFSRMKILFEKKLPGLFSLYPIDLPCHVDNIIRVGSRSGRNAYRRSHVSGFAERTFFDVPARSVQYDFPDGPVFQA